MNNEIGRGANQKKEEVNRYNVINVRATDLENGEVL